MIDLHIQIVNYKTKQYLVSCLHDVIQDLQDMAIEYQITVVDNDSGDDLSELELNYRDQVHFEYLHENKGFGAAHNYAAKRVDARYVLILNPDIRFLASKTIQGLLQYLESHNDVNVVGPKLLTADRKAQRWDHGELNGCMARIMRGLCLSYWADTGDTREVSWISGAFFFIRKSTFDRVGGFDEDFFLYGEEVDLCLRICSFGGIVYYPSITAMHIGSVVAKKSKYMAQSNDVFFRKHCRKKWSSQIIRCVYGVQNMLIRRGYWD